MENEQERSFANMSFDEIQRLSPEEFSSLMRAAESAYYHNLEDLGDPLYPGYDFDMKVRFWADVLNRQMRHQAESGLDVYGIFSPLWYEAVKRLEPGLDAIMDQVFRQPVFSEWSKKEYLDRIHKSV